MVLYNKVLQVFSIVMSPELLMCLGCKLESSCGCQSDSLWLLEYSLWLPICRVFHIVLSVCFVLTKVLCVFCMYVVTKRLLVLCGGYQSSAVWLLRCPLWMHVNANCSEGFVGSFWHVK